MYFRTTWSLEMGLIKIKPVWTGLTSEEVIVRSADMKLFGMGGGGAMTVVFVVEAIQVATVHNTRGPYQSTTGFSNINSSLSTNKMKIHLMLILIVFSAMKLSSSSPVLHPERLPPDNFTPPDNLCLLPPTLGYSGGSLFQSQSRTS